MKFLCFNSLRNCLTIHRRSLPKVSQKRFASLGIIGAPTCAGQPRPGVELGPNAIRSSGLIELIENLGHDVIDFGDFSSDLIENSDNCDRNATNILKNVTLVRHMVDQLFSLVNKVIESNRIPVMLGGDHSTAIASVCANSQESDGICVLWVDAHADINTKKTTRTGNFHGMPVSFLIKQIDQMFNNPNERCLPVNPCIDAKNFAFIGLRDVEFSELDLIRKTNITHFTTQDIDKLGIHEVIARSLDRINPKLKRKIHVSFDIDAIDPLWAPSTGTPVSGGLTLREGLCIGEEIYATNMFSGLDLVEVNPSIGNHMDVKKTVDCALCIILSFLGKPRMGYYESTQTTPQNPIIMV